MLTPYDPFNDRVIAAAGRYQAVHDHQPITMMDNQVITLHRVRVNGEEDTFLRAVANGDSLMVVFDLRHVAPELCGLRCIHPHDVPGLIRYTLRGTYQTAQEALAAMNGSPVRLMARVTTEQTAATGVQGVIA